MVALRMQRRDPYVGVSRHVKMHSTEAKQAREGLCNGMTIISTRAGAQHLDKAGSLVAALQWQDHRPDMGRCTASRQSRGAYPKRAITNPTIGQADT